MADESKAAEIVRKATAHFALASPPGRMAEVLACLEGMFDGATLDDAARTTVFRKYHRKHSMAFPSGYGTHKVVISDETAVDDEHYVDTVGRKVFRFNHLLETVDEADVRDADTELDAALEPHREALLQSLTAYCTEYYDERATPAVAVRNGQLIAIVSAILVNKANHWSGNWVSKWTVTPGAGSATVSGAISMAMHYSESGTLQMNQSKVVPESSITFADSAALAKAVLRVITRNECELHERMDEMYESMAVTTLKELRRILPVHGTTMDWNVHSHRMRGKLG